jgi:hypothetical protein
MKSNVKFVILKTMPNEKKILSVIDAIRGNFKSLPIYSSGAEK